MTDAMGESLGADHLSCTLVFEAPELDSLLQLLVEDGYGVIGPTLRDGAIGYAPIQGTGDLPRGWSDVQGPGHYRLLAGDPRAYFGHTLGAQSFKPYLTPPVEALFSIRRSRTGDFTVQTTPAPTTKLALMGIRSCDVAALAALDAVFLRGMSADPRYRARRQPALLIAVNCTSAAPTCFCASMGTGPRTHGADLAMTEVLTPSTHHFVVSEASARGRALLRRLPHRPATPEELATCAGQETRAIEQMSGRLDTRDLEIQVARAQEHPHWEQVAQRCLSCANCTMVCPTCVCFTLEDEIDLGGERATRTRRWDSCFNREFSELHGQPVRASAAARYRQWLSHKLSTWRDQFATTGCVGCGRCITWCPVGIDITEEAEAVRHPGAG